MTIADRLTIKHHYVADQYYLTYRIAQCKRQKVLLDLEIDALETEKKRIRSADGKTTEY